MPLLCGLLTAVVQGSRFSSLANLHVSYAVYAEPLSVSHCTAVSGNLSPKRFSTDLSITSCTVEKLRPQSVTSRIQPGSDVIVCAEMDEQWGYVGAKSRQRWLFYAYDRIRRTVVAHVFGERTLSTLERLLGLLSAFEVVVWMTDGWPLYESRLKGRTARYQQAIYAAH